MCGIVGLLDPRRGRPEAESQRIVEAMAGRMVPRGPDGSGSWVDPDAGVALGHRRLSILDLSPAGAQPMVSADGRWVITFNGEVYDHAELAADLDAVGVRRRGHSDTEILLEAVARWGLRDVLERVDGMWAFGLWDRRERSLTLVRDRMGEKPLSYGHLGSGEFVFASTLDVLRAHPDWDRPVDRDALALFFRFKYVPAPWSIFSGVHKLEPGCTVTVGADGAVGPVERYWDYLDLVGRTTPFDGSPEDAVDELDRLLRRSVRRRMVADVPVGAFLSGGIDSSTVVAVAQQESAVPLRTFTIGSTSADFDESSDARRVAEHLGA
ncbi:MAG: asparagine synthase (glutamine-hydrolyzing), partial [Microthrixaceae bacterium]